MRRRVCFSHYLWLALVFFTIQTRAHQIPSIQLELDLTSNGEHTLRLNIDPRLVISSAPSSVPPIGASWYREQTPEELKQTHQQTIDYIARTFHFDYSGRPVAFQWSIQPMDGATNEALTEESAEVHLLAVATRVPEAAESALKVSLAAHAQAALTIITLVDGSASNRAQVLFPGEISKSVTWRTKAAPPTPIAAPVPQFRWYVEPVTLVKNHVLTDDLAAHVWFIFLMAFCTSRSVFALAGLGLYHGVHLLAAFAFSVNQTVLPQPDWVWPGACSLLLVLPFLKSRRVALGIAVLMMLAVLHVLNEWPTAVEPRIQLLMEGTHAALHFGMVLPLLLIRLITGTKKAAIQPPREVH